MARKRASLSDLLNDLTFRTIYDKFRLIAINMYEWENLPAGIEPRHIEKLLFEHGKAIFFRDPVKSYMCLQAQAGNMERTSAASAPNTRAYTFSSVSRPRSS